jgi:hypothetical protein
VRVLARAWIRVMWRCWVDRVPYDVSKHTGAIRLAEAINTKEGKNLAA